MVKPTPASKATPNIWCHVTPSGRSESLNLTIIRVKNVMPASFPITSPAATPMLPGLTIAVKKSLPMIMPEFDKANSDIIKKATHGCIEYSIFCSGVSASWLNFLIFSMIVCWSAVIREPFKGIASSKSLVYFVTCSMYSDFCILVLAGIVNETSTPVMVACPPENKKQVQTAMPTKIENRASNSQHIT